MRKSKSKKVDLPEVKPTEQDFEIFPTPKSSKNASMEREFSFQQVGGQRSNSVRHFTDPEENFIKPRWERSEYGSPQIYQNPNLGPGGENFMFGDSHENSADLFTDEGIVTKVSISFKIVFL